MSSDGLGTRRRRPLGCGWSGGSCRTMGATASTGEAEQALERGVVWVTWRAQLAPRAVLRILVVAEADEARPVAEAIALHLVVAHLDDELRLHRRLLQVARPPTIRFREAAIRLGVDQREHVLGDLLVLRGCDRSRPHVVEPAVVAVEAEQEGRDPVGLRLPAQADDDGVRGLVRLHLDHGLA